MNPKRKLFTVYRRKKLVGMKKWKKGRIKRKKI
jgi:hypothetical protein